MEHSKFSLGIWYSNLTRCPRLFSITDSSHGYTPKLPGDIEDWGVTHIHPTMREARGIDFGLT